MFGDVERVPPTPKSYHKSSIPIGADGTDAPKAVNGNGKLSNGNGAMNGNGIAHENGNHKVEHSNGHVANGTTNGSRPGKYCFFDL